MSETNVPQPTDPGAAPQQGSSNVPAHESGPTYNQNWQQPASAPVPTQSSQGTGTQSAPSVQPTSQQGQPWPNPAPQGGAPNSGGSYQSPYAAPAQGTPQGPQQPYQAPNPYPSEYSNATPYGVGDPGAGATPPLNKPYYGIGFPEAVSRFFKKYAVFTGRASKGEFWWVFLFMILVNIVLSIISGALDTFGQLLGVVWALATVVPLLALGVRRLHDTNRETVWILLPAIPLILTSVLSWYVSFTVSSDPYGASRLVADENSGLYGLIGLLALVGLISSIVLFVANSNPAGIRFDDDVSVGTQPPNGPYPQGPAPYTQNGAPTPYGPTGQPPQGAPQSAPQSTPQGSAPYPQQTQYPQPR